MQPNNDTNQTTGTLGKDVQTTVWLPEELWLKLKALAAARRTSLRAVVTEAVKEHLRKQAA